MGYSVANSFQDNPARAGEKFCRCVNIVFFYLIKGKIGKTLKPDQSKFRKEKNFFQRQNFLFVRQKNLCKNSELATLRFNEAKG
jgi:hypothetical protein